MHVSTHKIVTGINPILYKVLAKINIDQSNVEAFTLGGGGGNRSAVGVLERLHLLGIRLPKNDVRGVAPPDFASRPADRNRGLTSKCMCNYILFNMLVYLKYSIKYDR